jgi:hypothetical protein
MAKSKTFQEDEYAKAYGLILITCWSKPGRRALIRTWDDLQLANASNMDKACRDLKAKLDKLSAKRSKLLIQTSGEEEHYLLYAVFQIDLD